MRKKIPNGRMRNPKSLLRAFRARTHGRTKAGEEEGAALVELAISAAVIFALMIGIFEICLALYAYHFTADAAREATRWAMVRGSQCSTYSAGLGSCNAQGTDITTFVQNLGYPGLSASNFTVTSTWYSHTDPPNPTWTACGSTCNDPGNMVKVAVQYNFPLHIPFWQNGTLAVSSTSQMVISQ